LLKAFSRFCTFSHEAEEEGGGEEEAPTARPAYDAVVPRAKLSPAAAAPTKLSTVCAELSKLGAGTVRTQKGLLKKMCRVYLQARHRGLPRIPPRPNRREAGASERTRTPGRVRCQDGAASCAVTAKKAEKKARRTACKPRWGHHALLGAQGRWKGVIPILLEESLRHFFSRTTIVSNSFSPPFSNPFSTCLLSLTGRATASRTTSDESDNVVAPRRAERRVLSRTIWYA
jgi:hypothetical protein